MEQILERPKKVVGEAEHKPKASEKRVEKKVLARSFQELNLSPAMLDSLESAGFAQPTPIQAALIPLALEQYDVLGQARTGTGKTCIVSPFPSSSNWTIVSPLAIPRRWYLCRPAS